MEFVAKLLTAAPAELTSYMNDYFAGTKPNPLNNRERIWNNTISIEVYPFDGRIHLGHIQVIVAEDRQKGSGSQALQWLCQLADKHHVAMEATVQSTGQGANRLEKDQLFQWYGKNGFTRQPDYKGVYSFDGSEPSDFIIREPKGGAAPQKKLKFNFPNG